MFKKVGNPEKILEVLKDDIKDKVICEKCNTEFTVKEGLISLRLEKEGTFVEFFPSVTLCEKCKETQNV